MWSQGQLWCSECKRFKPVKQFYRWRNPGEGQNTNYGYRSYCIDCENNAKRDREWAKKYNRDRNNGLKVKFVELSGGCCQRCGYKEFTAGLDFHHIYRAEKKHTPTSLIYNNNFAETWKELDKCCLLCRNCHSGYTGNLWRAEFIKRDGLGWTVGASLPLDDMRYETENPPVYKQADLPDAYRVVGPEQMALFEQRAFYITH